MKEEIGNSITQNIAQSIAYHLDFYEFLPFSEAVESFSKFLEKLYHISAQSSNSEENGPQIEEYADLLDKLSTRLIVLLQEEKEDIDSSKKLDLARAFNENPVSSIKILNKQKNLQHLRFMLTDIKPAVETNISSIVNVSPQKVFEFLIQGDDEILVTKGIHAFKTKFIDENTTENYRLFFIHSFWETLKQEKVSDFKREFIIEWIFESSLLNAVLHPQLTFTFISTLRETFKNFGTDVRIVQGVIKAFQKDFVLLSKSYHQEASRSSKNALIDKTNDLIEVIYPCLVNLTKEDISFVSKDIIGFSFDLPVLVDQHRLLKWSHWRWVRMLATNIWDGCLREPPKWVVSCGSQYCAIIFDAAPAVWLKSFAHFIIERVYAETLIDGFEPTEQQYDYVEFLVRNLKKKSPYFASHPGSYSALYLLNRLTPYEKHKEGDMELEHLSESNPVSQALGILLRMVRV